MKITQNIDRLIIKEAGIDRTIISWSIVALTVAAIMTSWQSTSSNLLSDVAISVMGCILIVMHGTSLLRTRTWRCDFILNGSCVVRSALPFRRPNEVSFGYNDIKRSSIEARTYLGVTVCHIELEIDQKGWTTILDSHTYNPFFSHLAMTDKISNFFRVPQTSERAVQRSQRSFMNKKLF